MAGSRRALVLAALACTWLADGLAREATPEGGRHLDDGPSLYLDLEQLQDELQDAFENVNLEDLGDPSFDPSDPFFNLGDLGGPFSNLGGLVSGLQDLRPLRSPPPHAAPPIPKSRAALSYGPQMRPS